MSKITSGIYTIKNTINGKMYIGSSKNILHRWNQSHRPALRKGSHCNKHLQHAWNKYGEMAFEFQVIEECHENLLDEKEGFWIEYCQSWDRKFGYNLNRIIDDRVVFSEETKKLRREKWEKIKGEDGYKVGFIEHKLTEEKKNEIIRLRADGKTWGEVFDLAGISKTHFYRAMETDGKYSGSMKRSSYKTMTEEVKSKAIELRQSGKSWKEIGKILGVDRTLFYRHGLAEKQKNMVRKTVTDEIRSQVALLRQTGISWKSVAKIVGVSANTLTKYCNNEN